MKITTKMKLCTTQLRKKDDPPNNIRKACQIATSSFRSSTNEGNNYSKFLKEDTNTLTRSFTHHSCLTKSNLLKNFWKTQIKVKMATKCTSPTNCCQNHIKAIIHTNINHTSSTSNDTLLTSTWALKLAISIWKWLGQSITSDTAVG